MTIVKALDANALYTTCDVSQFTFETTEELEDLSEIIGQDRAIKSLRFGINMRKDGYNLFVLGPYGMGKHTLVKQYLEQQAAFQETPSDWCYVHNFKQPHKPLSLELPPGDGSEFQHDIKLLLEDIRSSLPLAFETKEYRTKIQEIEAEIESRREKAFRLLEAEAEKENIMLAPTPSGFMFLPVKDGKTINPKDYAKLQKDEKETYEASISKLEAKVNNFIQQIPIDRREARDRIKILNREVAIYSLGNLIHTITQKYQHSPQIIAYLDDYQENVVENIEQFISQDGKKNLLGIPVDNEEPFKRYSVNLLVDNGDTKGAPVIYQDNPTFPNLVGRIEHISQIGALITDFTLIKPGALHEANGGFLILDIRKLLLQPYAWEGLKRALFAKKIRIQSLADMFSLVSTVSLDAEPIPMNVKVVLLGDRLLYYLLLEYDTEFPELFKIAADFEEEINRNSENDMLYARMIATLVKKENLRAFDRSAVARIIEFSSRQANDASKMTTHMLSVADLMRESDQWAEQDNVPLVNEESVQHAIDEKTKRHDRMRDKVQEEIQRETLLIDCASETVGQVNGLSVISLGNFTFALPTRITATTFAGDGNVVDISKEVKLGGAIHSKGMMILTSFINARFAQEHPLSFSASITFEQTYGKVDGDSASVAELCALMSSLAGIPIKQSLAVTGSINQLGQVQAIGGVNEKIEGFFDTCTSIGKNDQQGVLIPAANVKHLMLRKDIVDAAKNGTFHIYPISTIDDAITLLTGVDAGEKNKAGLYPENSINYLINTRLQTLFKKRQELKNEK